MNLSMSHGNFAQRSSLTLLRICLRRTQRCLLLWQFIIKVLGEDVGIDLHGWNILRKRRWKLLETCDIHAACKTNLRITLRV